MNDRDKKIITEIVRRRRAAAAAVAIILKSRRRVRRWWIHPVNQKRLQQGDGDWNNLINEMRLYDEDQFFNYTRLTVSQFDELLSLIQNRLTKISKFRTTIPPGARLAITLRFLATGDSLPTIASAFRIGKSTACNVIKETCNALWAVLSPKYMKFPSEVEWQQLATNYETLWNLPHCVGAIDGKQVVIQAPKQSFSIILFAISDANYLFTYVDIGAYGSQTDGGVLRESSFGNKFFNGELDLPSDKNINNTNIKMSYYFVGDETFPLHKNLLRPYGGTNLTIEQRIYNYRLSRARRCIENAFGILVARFGIFHRAINAEPQTVDSIVKATVCLHNFIKCTAVRGNRYSPTGYTDRFDSRGNIIPGEWRKEIPENPALCDVRQLIGSRNCTRTAEQYRSVMKNYVNSPTGAVPSQNNII